MPLIEKFSGPGSTPSRRRFWDNVADAVASCRKLPGKNVSVTEYDSGSLINVNPQRQGQGASCPPDDASITVTFSGIVIDCGCREGAGIIATDISVNGSFVIPSVSAGQWQGDGGSVTFVAYENTDCTGDTTTTTQTGLILAICTGGSWQIEYSFEGAFDAFENGFRTGEGAVLSPLPNLASCAGGFNDIGHGGTATIS